MRDVHEVLREKEQEVEQLVREIEALRLTASMLSDDSDAGMISDEYESRDSAGVADTAEFGANKLSRLKRLAMPLLNLRRAAG